MDFRHLRKLEEGFTVSLPTDEGGFTGRQCPDENCRGYFKIEFGTGLDGEDLPCYCPYCGHVEDQSEFMTDAQERYVMSIAEREVMGAVHDTLKSMEFDIKPKGAFGIGMSMKVEKPRPTSIRHYDERELESEVVCGNCTLRYAVYGSYAYCPDCGKHNSAQILDVNLGVVERILALAEAHPELATQLTGDALENVVSALDGFGRETCKVRAARAANPAKAQNVSFQNLDRARKRISDLFGVDLAAALQPDEWTTSCRGFQKRHVIAHKSGIVDQEYLDKTGNTSAVVGRKLAVSADEVRELIGFARRLGQHLVSSLPETDQGEK
ncbi:MAG: hypothetical protein ACLFVU_11555 [Phycisphaerae bacterium]